MPTNYSGIYIPPPADWIAKYVDGGIFTRFSTAFTVENAVNYGMLVVEVLTNYEDPSRSAIVLINNNQVGMIEPRPASRYGPNDLQLYSVFFRVDTALIDRGPQPRPGVRTGYQFLEIDPVRAPNQPADFMDALVIGKWHILYWQSLLI